MVRVGGGLAAALLVALIVCEAIGWPFLAGPAERALTRVLQREVRLHDGDGDGATRAGATLHLLGHLRVRAPKVHIGAPAWSDQPFFLEADNAQLTLSYAALWRAHRHQALDIHHLSADNLVVHAQRTKDGRASWQFGDPARKTATPSDEGMVLPTIRELVLKDGTVTYDDVPFDVHLAIKASTAEGSGAKTPTAAASGPPTGLVASASGTYAGNRVSAQLHAPGALALLKTGVGAPTIPIVLRVEAGDSRLDFRGTVTDVTHFEDLTGVFLVKGPSLAAAGEPFGVTLPTTGAFRIDGRIAKVGEVWNFVADDATVGASRLNAALTFDRGHDVPLLSGRVGGPRFYLADLAPSVGAAQVQAPTRSVPTASKVGQQQKAKAQQEDERADRAAAAKDRELASQPKAVRDKVRADRRDKGAHVLPERSFDLPSLAAMNANVLLAFDRMELGHVFATPLQPLRAHLTLNNSKLTVADIDARTADGNVGGSISLDAKRRVPLWTARLDWSRVRLERWLNQSRGGGAPPYITGRLDGRADLRGSGQSTAQMLGSLDGSFVTWLEDGSMSHLVTEAAGLDVAQALGVLVKGDDALPLGCAIADIEVKGGALTPRAFLIDSKDSTVMITGHVSLAQEALDLRAVTAPKDFSPLALRTPVHIGGTLGDPAISLEKGPLARKLASGLLLGLINPVAALLPLVDPGDANKAPVGCSALLQRARHGAAAAAAG